MQSKSFIDSFIQEASKIPFEVGSTPLSLHVYILPLTNPNKVVEKRINDLGLEIFGSAATTIFSDETIVSTRDLCTYYMTKDSCISESSVTMRINWCVHFANVLCCRVTSDIL